MAEYSKQNQLIKQIEAEAEAQEISSSERSAFLNRARKGGSGSRGCYVIARSLDLTIMDQTIKYYPNYSSLLSGGTIISSMPDITNMLPPGYNNPNYGDGIACYGNKIWISFYYQRGGSGPYNAVIELDFDQNNLSVSFNRVINIPSSAGDQNSVRCSISSTELIISDQTSGTAKIHSLDISGTTAIATYLFDFPSNYGSNPDMVYVPSSDIFVSTSGPVFDSSGIQIGFVNGAFGHGAFCIDGDVYFAWGSGTKMAKVDFLNPFVSAGISYYSMHPDIIIPDVMNDSASNPECCDVSSVSTVDCYNIGNIGPEGGIIFSVPLGHPQNNGINQSNYYYEVALNDIAVAGTPSSGFNQTCGVPSIEFDAWMRVGPVTNPNTNRGIVGLGTANTVSVGWEVDWPYLPSGTTITAVILGSNHGILYFSNHFDWTTLPVSPSGAGSPFLPPLYAGFGHYNQVGNWFPNQVNTSGNPPDYPFPTFLPPPGGISGWTVTGAEWGAYEKAPPAIQTTSAFGDGKKNTDTIDAFVQCPPPHNCHPWLDTHDIAATLCKQHGFTNDWFLPSRLEFKEMLAQVGPLTPFGSQINLQSPTTNSEDTYWTSSQYRHNPLQPIQDPDKYSWAYTVNPSGITPTIAYRCHALSVRPVRRFECEPKPPCIGCDCVEYNWRDGVCGSVIGSLCSSSSITGWGALTPITDWSTTNGGTIPGSVISGPGGDSVIGGDNCYFNINKTDVLGNYYSLNDFTSGSGKFKITMWDTSYNFMGKWEYDLDLVSDTPFGTYDEAPPIKSARMDLKNGVHLKGNYPYIWFGSGGSATGIFIKLEFDAVNGYETGCNSSIFGNPHPYDSPGSQDDWPAYCGPLWSVFGVYMGDTAIPRYATYQPTDLLGSLLTVHPDIYGAIPTFTGSPGFYPNSATAAHQCPCDYQVGDVGPAGGIIVATPHMSGTEILWNGAAPNPTDDYYEMSPVDLHTLYPPAISAYQGVEFGVANIDAQYTNGANLAASGELNTDSLLANYPNGAPLQGSNTISAFELCDNYSTLENGILYDDWFLPNIMEMWFICNNVPSINNQSLLHPPEFHNLSYYWTSNQSSDTIQNDQLVLWAPSWGVNIADEGYDSYFQSLPWQQYINPNLTSESAAYAVNVNDKVTLAPPFTQAGPPPLPGTIDPSIHVAHRVYKSHNFSVRAMRKFQCDPKNRPDASSLLLLNKEEIEQAFPLSESQGIMGLTSITEQRIECYEALEETKESTLESPTKSWGPEHQWCLCAVWTDSIHPKFRNHTVPGWYDTSWLCQDDPNQWWPRAFAHPGNPLNPSYPSNYDAFYHYIIQQIGPINIGDQIVFDTQPYGYASCDLGGVYGITKICFVYRGHYYMNPQTYTTLGAPSSNPVPGYDIHPGPCCESFPNTSIKTSWDCVLKDYDTDVSPPTPNYVCVQRNHSNGQFLTQQDCINSGCGSSQLPQPIISPTDY